MNKHLLQAWNRAARLPMLSLFLIPAACMVAVLPCLLHAQQAVAVDEQIFFLKNGTMVRDPSPPARGREIRIESAPGLQPQTLTDGFGEDVMDVQLGDLDNDGGDELVVLGRTKLAIYELNGGNYEPAPEKTLQLYDQSIYDNHPQISYEGVLIPFEGRLIREEDRSGGRLTIGDVDNDGDNELIITKIVAYTNLGFPFGQYRSVTEILKWEDDRYILQDVFTAGTLKDVVFILDLDGDGTNEIMIGRGSNYGIFGRVENPEEYANYDTNIYGYIGSYTGRYQPKGLLILTENTDEIIQVSAITIQDGTPIIFRVGLAAIAGDTRTLGTIRSYVLDQDQMSVLTSERMKLSSPGVPYIWGRDLEEAYQPIQVPTIGDLLQRRAEVNGLSVGDYDGDGILDIIVNTPGRALVYRLEEGQ